MTRRWIRAGGGAAAVLMVAVGIATNQVLNNGVWSWPWFVGAMAFAAATVALDRRMAAAEWPHATLRPDLVDSKGRPLLVSQVSPRQLGVHPSRFGSQGDSPYVHRDVDDALVNALRHGDHRLIIAQGPRLAGTTSTLAYAVQTCLPDHLLLVYTDDRDIELRQMVDQSRRWSGIGPGAVLWLDDVRPERLGQLSRALEDLPAGLRIMATVHDEHLKGFRIPEYVRQLLDGWAVVVSLGTISAGERDALCAESTYTALQPVLDSGDELLMGRLMVTLDQIQDALVPGRIEESADRIALLRAITDWYRVDMPKPLTREALDVLYAAYRRELSGQGPDWPVSTSRQQRALDWVTSENSREYPQLVDLKQVSRKRWYTPHPLLAVVADDTSQPWSWPVAQGLWEYANRILKGDQRRDIGYTALDKGAFAQACRLLSHNDTQVDPAAMIQVALWLHKTGNVTAARHWYTKVIATSHAEYAPKAMGELANLEREQGIAAEARRWYREAIATDHADVAPGSMVNLGSLEREQGNFDEARLWYRRAITAAHSRLTPVAMINLGLLEQELGELGEARRWWEQAAATGHADHAPRAMVNLGALQQEVGEFGKARRSWEWVAATGHVDHAPLAMLFLGHLKNQVGDPGEARRWFEQAAVTGHPDWAPGAANALGELEQEQGDLSEACRWWEQTAATNHVSWAPRAMVNLGNVGYKEGNFYEARRWYKKAIAGDKSIIPEVMVSLGRVAYKEHKFAEARHCWEQVIATHDAKQAPVAMCNLGVLEAGHGNLVEARRWYEKASMTDDPKVVLDAQRQLRDLKRREGDRSRAEHFGKYGWQAYTDPQLMKSSNMRPDSGKA